MTDQEVLDDLKKEMEKTAAAFRRELARTRTGRASTALLEGIQAEYYGAKTPLIQLATLSAPEPRLLIVQPFDKAALTAIEKAIQKSDLGLNPSNDGQVIRVAVPQLTEERRRELVKVLHRKAEEARVAVRNIRRDEVDHLRRVEKEGHVSKDEVATKLAEMQKTTDLFIARIDEASQRKEAEILEV